jgi:hypothetical protein
MSKLEKYDNIHLKDIVRSFKIHGNASPTFRPLWSLNIMSNCETFPDKILSIQFYGLYTHLSNSVTFSDKNTLFKQIWFFFKKNLSIKDF